MLYFFHKVLHISLQRLISNTMPNNNRYERVWDPAKAEQSGKLDFVHTRVESNKKGAAYDLFYKRGYRLPGFYAEVSNLSPTDCSNWTKQDKDRFRSAVFEHHEDMKEVSKQIGKPISECITYYIVVFKRTKSYKSLKRSMRRKANVTEGSAGTLVCNQCGKGGMLIACDTCEAHYHLSCASPPLQSIPDGTWACGNCKRETRSMLSSQDDVSCGTDQPPVVASAGTKMNESEDIEPKPEPEPDLKADTTSGSGNAGIMKIDSKETASKKRKASSDEIAPKKVDPEDIALTRSEDSVLSNNIIRPDFKITSAVGTGASNGHTFKPQVNSEQEGSKSTSGQTNCNKKMRMDGSNVGKNMSVVPV